LFERAECAFRILRSYAVASAHCRECLQQRLARRTVARKQFRRGIFRLRRNRQQQVLRRHKLVFKIFGFIERALENLIERWPHVLLRDAGNLRQSFERRFDLALQTFRAHPEPLQQGRDDPVRLRHKRRK
jgi:hypothetical protein